MPVNDDDIKRNGYPCSSSEFWWLVDEVERLRHVLTNVAENLHGAGLISDMAKADILAAAGSATPTEDHEPIAWTQDHNGEWHEAIAGPVTPTCPVRGDHMLRSTQEACPACTPHDAAVAGSATPTGDDNE